MSEVWKGIVVPLYTDAADGPGDFRRMVDSGPLPRYDTAAARDASIPSPVKGQVIYRGDAIAGGTLEFYNGTTWVVIGADKAPTTHTHLATQISTQLAAWQIPYLYGEIINTGTIARERLPGAWYGYPGVVDLNALAGNHLHDHAYYQEWEINTILTNYVSKNTSPAGHQQVPHTTVFSANPSIYAIYIETQVMVQTSSLDAKKDVGAVMLADNVFDRLNPISFRFKTDPDDLRMGFSYEEMVEVAPLWASHVNETKGINYWGMLPDFMAWTLATIRDLREQLSRHERAALA